MTALAFLRSVPRLLKPTGWLIVAIIAAFVLTGAYCSHRGAQGERDRQAVQTQKTEAKASATTDALGSRRGRFALPAWYQAAMPPRLIVIVRDREADL